ncbi:hypothetical protein [Leisingera caerulea]|uniref:Uncharacterized protein n=1 Tax=Leisingera caerulea TaxID=506591 RepID=A0A9Q9HNC2_LEICA|nr:hypothetical protein [Leisingera caerulea]UWQ55936.1 hypothetical protein K3721_19065 [Leisingera caerulea]
MRIGRKWWCTGCKAWHPLSRDIEGQTTAGSWCGASIRKALKERRNDLPFTHEAER